MAYLSGDKRLALNDALFHAINDAGAHVRPDIKHVGDTECGSLLEGKLKDEFDITWDSASNFDTCVNATLGIVRRMLADDAKHVVLMMKRHNSPEYTPVQYKEPTRTEDTSNILRKGNLGDDSEWFKVTRNEIIQFLERLLVVLPERLQEFRFVYYKDAMQQNFDQFLEDSTQ